MNDSFGTLYVVATPIGNMGDISERAVETLRACDVVACEDTRVTGNLLKRFEISKEMFVNEDSRERGVAPALLEILNHIRQNVEMIIFYEKRILMRRGVIESDFCREPSFGADRYFDRMFDEYYEMISEYFVK